MGAANLVALMSRLPHYFVSVDVAGMRVAEVGPMRRFGTNVAVVMRMAVNTVATVDAVYVMVEREGRRSSGCR